MRRLAAAAAMALLLGAGAGCAGDYPQTTFRPVTEFAAQLNDLMSLVFWLTMAILVIVYSVLLYIVLRFRDRPGAEPPKKIYGNNVAEILWTLGPAVIVAIMLVPTVRGIFDSYRPADEDALVIEAIGHQWWWEYRYPELGVVTANQAYMPVGRPIEVQLWTADVLHSWWVPRIAGKRDNFPLRTEEAAERPNWHVLRFTIDESGEFLGQCAEYCGLSHALMATQVVAVEDFDAWVESMRRPGTPAGVPTADGAADGADADEPADADVAGVVPAPQQTGQDAPAPQASDPEVQRGYEIFTSSTCTVCHTIGGTPAQGRIGPDLTRFGDRWSIGAGTLEMTHENLVRWIRNPAAVKPGALMPGTETPGGGFPATGLSDDEVAAVATYLMSLE